MNRIVDVKDVIISTFAGSLTGAAVSNYLKVITPAGGAFLLGTTELCYVGLKYGKKINDRDKAIYQLAISLFVGIGIAFLAGYGMSITALLKFHLCAAPVLLFNLIIVRACFQNLSRQMECFNCL